MASQLNKTGSGFWSDREKVSSPNQVKSVKRLKSPKKSQECKKSTNDMKVEDVFLNSKYFKHQSRKKAALSFCSGENGENHWTVDQANLEVAALQKFLQPAFPPNDVIKKDTAVSTEKETTSCKGYAEKNEFERENSQEVTEKLLDEILEGKRRTDRDLVTLITEQMFLAERELQITRTHLVDTVSKLNERDLEIIRLHERVRLLEKTGKLEASKGEEREAKECSSKTFDDYQRLIVASEKLKKQVKDMEEFLNDYGLVWVGDKEANIKPDFDKIIKSFQRLNAVACQPKIIQTTLGARFKLPREIPLVLYSNGLLLRDQFRDYNTTTTTLFLQDVEDGYFPSELQTEFPEGVPFEVVDKRNEVYNPNRKAQVFEGQGNRLGSALEGSNLSVVYLEPIKQSKTTDLNPIIARPSHHKSPIKKLQKKRSRYGTSMERLSTEDSIYSLPISTNSDVQSHSQEKTFKVKVRFGSEITQSFVLEVAENGKMVSFQRALHRTLCKKFHDECLVDNESMTRETDFELHVYGKPPFRLSQHLDEHIKECGIADNCVINVTEI